MCWMYKKKRKKRRSRCRCKNDDFSHGFLWIFGRIESNWRFLYHFTCAVLHLNVCTYTCCHLRSTVSSNAITTSSMWENNRQHVNIVQLSPFFSMCHIQSLSFAWWSNCRRILWRRSPERERDILLSNFYLIEWKKKQHKQNQAEREWNTKLWKYCIWSQQPYDIRVYNNHIYVAFFCTCAFMMIVQIGHSYSYIHLAYPYKILFRIYCIPHCRHDTHIYIDIFMYLVLLIRIHVCELIIIIIICEYTWSFRRNENEQQQPQKKNDICTLVCIWEGKTSIHIWYNNDDNNDDDYNNITKIWMVLKHWQTNYEFSFARRPQLFASSAAPVPTTSFIYPLNKCRVSRVYQ